MVRVFFFFLFVGCIQSPAWSQLQGSDSQSNLQSLGSGDGMFRSFDNRFKGIVGYPTILEKYVPARITLTSGKIVNYDLVNYDAFQDDLLVMRQGAEVIVRKDMVQEFMLLTGLDSLPFVRLKVNTVEEGFYQPLVKGEIELYKKVVKTIAAPTNTGAYSTGKTYSEFVEEKKYFWRSTSGELKAVKNKKSLLADFPEHQKELELFLQKNQINVKDEQHLKAVFIYLNR